MVQIFFLHRSVFPDSFLAAFCDFCNATQRCMFLFLGGCTHHAQAKFILYLSNVAAKDDVETQRNGLVVVVWFASTYKINYRIPLRQSPLQNYGSWGCVRVCAIHLCTPDTPSFRFRRSIISLRAFQNRSRLRVHIGEPVELRYKLQGFGIPTGNIPMTWSGNVKVVIFKNWMKVRKAIEDDQDRRQQNQQKDARPSDSNTNNTNDPNHRGDMSKVVECPYSNDVIFRQGTSLFCHPGNAKFRSLVEKTVSRLQDTNPTSNVKDNETSKDGNKTDNNTRGGNNHNDPSLSPAPTSLLINDIIKEIVNKDKGRILVWTQNHNDVKYGCWCTLTNEAQIYSKIEYIVRDFIRGSHLGNNATSRAERQKSNFQMSESSTSMFVAAGNTAMNPNKRNKRIKRSSADSPSSSDDDHCNWLRTGSH